MELEKFKQKFNLPRINRYVKVMSDEQIQDFWQLLIAVKEIFPTIDIYHAGFSWGYLGFGNKSLDAGSVRDFLFVMHFKRDENKQAQFILYIADKSFKFEKVKEIMIDQAYDDEVKKNITLKDWLLKFKKVALEVGINCDGHNLFPIDYEKEVFFSTEEAKQYLQTRYQQIKPETQKIIGFKNNLNRELALVLEKDTPSIFIGLNPNGNGFFDFQFIENRSDELNDEYNKEKSRHSGLKANAPSLYTGNDAFYIEVNSLQDLEGFCDWYDFKSDLMLNENLKEDAKMVNKKNDQDLNRILFGAAGTGKTYNTINHALSIIEHKPLELLEQEDRKALKLRFDQYKEQGQIKFVTFHQSFSYEDFVEGIRAETNDDGQLSYDVKAGVFKEICDIAFNQNLPHSNVEEVMNDFCKQVAEQPLKLKTKTGLTYEITYEGGKTLKCFLLESVNKGTYSLSLDTIRKLLHGVELGDYGMPSYIKPIVSLLSNKIQFLDEEKQDIGQKPCVLIIDEINRGNISRIFGELITLIEDSKRQGAEEELSVTLPYSKEEFSVPSNVYIIGTMNSSDRSLTGLDIALRRRFTFFEMPPKPELLNLVEVEGLNVGELLTVINQRIEVLLDRDHCIGHANFMSLKKQRTREHLATIFKQKIIPQLQEYFFDDWSKINMVLNANGMLQAKTVQRLVLFPNVDTETEGFFEEQKTWHLNDTAFDSIASFSKIIKH